MSYTRSTREENEFAKVVYDDRRTLRNTLGITDFDRLERAERELTSRRAAQDLPSEAKELNYAGFKAIHKHLFGDLYEWAGQERRYTTGRGPAPFAPPEQITQWMDKRFSILKKERFLQGLDKQAFAKRAAEHVNEINAAHPFIDGNGRAQRMWLRLVSDKAGFEFKLRSSDKDRWNEASRLGFERVEHGPMADLISDRLRQFERDKSKGQLTEKARRARADLPRPPADKDRPDRGC